ncbi:hypothetical protein KBY97_05660 [Synechococcus sp. ATX 2A4]|uniref:hypothetical protein n=1 Tax=Synechococcus sp. ATX 2A4 TaxID=2823727 RepID=UPI0020CC57BF|nr:hypothetical protein [Synechococcus sp. ATX 2A4]MCP9884610.1 hypothetical protein [Synechococcus sp. ATX 2A4]
MLTSPLVLAGAGPRGLAALPLAAPRLQSFLALPATAELSDLGARSAEPDQLMAALQSQQGGALVALEEDPGRWLPVGTRWAEVLGAWRQPTLLLIAADDAGNGLAAAYAALLERSAVPLLGLVQWDGSWDGPARSCEGLPWLGGLQPAGSSCASGAEVLVEALKLRWQRFTSF